jgi:hypothetical protein
MQNRSISQMDLNPIPTLLYKKKAKHMKTLAASVAMVLVMAVGSGQAEAKDIKYNGTFSGSVTATEIDTNTDGFKAALFTVNGKTNLGPTDVQAVIEFVPAGPATCLDGQMGIELTPVPGIRRGVIRFERKDGDLLLTEVSSQTRLCASASGIQFLDAVLDFIGGTGQFENANGSITVTATTQVLFQDGVGHFLGAQSGEFTGTIIVP